MVTPSQHALLAEGVAHLTDARTAPALCALLKQYLEELILFNTCAHLVHVTHTEELITHHLLDSLSAWPHFTNARAIADIGSGAGLPGIPLACALALYAPETELTLIERREKRIAFLENACARLALPHLRIVHADAHDLTPYTYDAITFRALCPLNHPTVYMLLNKLRPGGVILAYKGKRKLIEQETRDFLPQSCSVFPLHVPFLHEARHLVAIHTPCAAPPQ
ncbi:glucose-inhibited division protein B [Treponema paraluiscuniculi Cuniculi A]|uniref:Ribosomal RNA small subunit methyltransferase G n=2 Tax=Treponema paraluiscuniculi TaxID=53435 RepID=F7XR27_TREPU|nr:16S rRNA (guanine(527)-N(7))-methyltransferase RsmG [Treponema paraluiscuniculi]AEH40869.1 glucose-inhibited division protein B [Treponema paraluiscuniculi Cuniculi A]WKC72798.1 glucose-inhibited division protein B [Treponema paraluiscuniculi]